MYVKLIRANADTWLSVLSSALPTNNLSSDSSANRINQNRLRSPIPLTEQIVAQTVRSLKTKNHRVSIEERKRERERERERERNKGKTFPDEIRKKTERVTVLENRKHRIIRMKRPRSAFNRAQLRFSNQRLRYLRKAGKRQDTNSSEQHYEVLRHGQSIRM